MAKLTKRQRGELERIRYDLKRALDYINAPNTAVCRIGGPATTTLHMTRQLDGRVFMEVNKEIGSHLCGLGEGLRKVDAMLND
jgi:hypothetical protein